MTFIAPPNLTDSSQQGLYGAVKIVPNAAISIGNRITSAIGAPGLSGNAATVQHMPSGGSGAPRPWTANIPDAVKSVYAKGRVIVANFLASLQN